LARAASHSERHFFDHGDAMSLFLHSWCKDITETTLRDSPEKKNSPRTNFDLLRLLIIFSSTILTEPLKKGILCPVYIDAFFGPSLVDKEVLWKKALKK
jgi:hypothetical protein